MYLKDFEIRWNDMDANRHLANSAYVNYMSHTRMAFLTDQGLGLPILAKHQMGPVVFDEHIFYFKEAFMGDTVRVSFQLGGMSEDGMFFRFLHNFYNSQGKNLAFCEIQGGWIDLNTRKLRGLPEELLPLMEKAPKSDDFKVLTKEDMRRQGRRPMDLS